VDCQRFVQQLDHDVSRLQLAAAEHLGGLTDSGDDFGADTWSGRSTGHNWLQLGLDFAVVATWFAHAPSPFPDSRRTKASENRYKSQWRKENRTGNILL
jgi:hypothetical protein